MINKNQIERGCFNTIRLFLALKVLCWHTVIHMSIDIPTSLYTFLSVKAVPLFFMISGFLIWGSIGKIKGFKEHCIKRLCRIYPELWVAVLIELAVILYIYHSPIDWDKFGVFAITQSTFFQFYTPDFLRGYGCGVPNGSLWTICVLIQFYILSYYIYRILHGRNNILWISVILFSLILSVFQPIIRENIPNIIGKLLGQSIFPYLWIFLIAAYISERKEDIIPFVKKYCFLFLFILVPIKYFNIDIKASYDILFTVFAFLFFLGFAYSFPKLDIKTDISYGLYLYHMTVVNVFIVLGYIYKPYYLIGIIVITLFLSWISCITIGAWGQNFRNLALKKLQN